MTSLLLTAPGVTLDNTLGATFLGVVGSCILFGVTSLQAYLYFYHFPQDSLLHKVAVACLWCLDAVHLCCILHATYHYLISNFGLFTLDIIWSIKTQVIINVIIIMIVQALYSYRVWLLGGFYKGVLRYVSAFVLACGFLLSIVLSYKICTLSVFSGVQSISWCVYASFIFCTVTDFSIALAMCYYLHKSKGTESVFNSKISTIMQYSLGSGLLTSTCSLACIIAFALSPDSLTYLGLEFLLTKLYVGSFLVMLNVRQREDSHRLADSGFAVSNAVFKTSAQSPNGDISEHKYPWQPDVEGQSDADAPHREAGSPQERPNHAHQW